MIYVVAPFNHLLFSFSRGDLLLTAQGQWQVPPLQCSLPGFHTWVTPTVAYSFTPGTLLYPGSNQFPAKFPEK